MKWNFPNPVLYLKHKDVLQGLITVISLFFRWNCFGREAWDSKALMRMTVFLPHLMHFLEYIHTILFMGIKLCLYIKYCGTLKVPKRTKTPQFLELFLSESLSPTCETPLSMLRTDFMMCSFQHSDSFASLNRSFSFRGAVPSPTDPEREGGCPQAPLHLQGLCHL